MSVKKPPNTLPAFKIQRISVDDSNNIVTFQKQNVQLTKASSSGDNQSNSGSQSSKALAEISSRVEYVTI